MATTATKPRLRGQPPRKVGAPLALHDVVRERDGKQITAREAVLELVRTGLPAIYAASSVGFTQVAYCEWIRKAGRARARQIALDHGAAGEALTDEERELVEFANEVESAESTAMATDWTRLGMLAAGGIPLETVTTTIKVAVDADGRETVLERSTKTVRDKTLPSVQALTWRMQRRWPEAFAERVEVTGAGGGPVDVEVTAAGLVSRLRSIVDATHREVANDPGGAGARAESERPAPGGAAEVAAGPARAIAAQEAVVPSPDADVPEPPG